MSLAEYPPEWDGHDKCWDCNEPVREDDLVRIFDEYVCASCAKKQAERFSDNADHDRMFSALRVIAENENINMGNTDYTKGWNDCLYVMRQLARIGVGFSK